MKRLLIAATLLFAAGFVACDKSDDTSVEKDIKVEFSVAGKDCFNTTRAVKSDWANGDQILILFKTGGAWLGKENSKDNTITLTYNASASTWALTKNNWDDDLTNSTSGEFLAVHYRGDMGLGASEGSLGYLFNYTAGEVLHMSGGTYTITDGVMTLSTLVLKLSNDAVQFSVQYLASNSDTWEMWVAYDNKGGDYKYPGDSASPVQGYNAGKVLYRTDGGFLGTYGNEWMSNVVNGSDRSFFGTFDNGNDEVTTRYVFVLKNVTKTKYYKFEYAPSPFVKLAGKNAYLLPPLTLEGDGVTPATGCLWEKL